MFGRDFGQIPQRPSTVKYFTVCLINMAITDNKAQGGYAIVQQFCMGVKGLCFQVTGPEGSLMRGS